MALMTREPAAPPQPWTPRVKLIIAVAVIQLLIAGGWALLRGAQEFLVYAAFMPLVMLGVGRLHAHVRFSEGLLWCLSVLALAHLAGGLVPVPPQWPTELRDRLYDLWLVPFLLKYDHLVHAFGNATATWLCWQFLQRTVASKSGWGFRDLRPTPALLFFCVLAGMGIGSVNEILEFLTTHVVSDHGVGGYRNTLMDLVANTIGSLIVAAMLWRHGRKVCDPDARVVCRRQEAD
ncbi:MAG: hypothetical protein HYT90_05915 [Candidatus Omnitrophica bacterium]|nr:hypothetical protein [Candidatus Omnitrophota bacterium]